MNTSIKSIAAFTAGLLLVLPSYSGDFLDHKPADAVDSGIVPVSSNTRYTFNGVWYGLLEYSSMYANIGYRALMLQDDMMTDDVMSRPMHGFNFSYQFNDVVMSVNNRTAFAWCPMYGTIDNYNIAISITAIGDDDISDFRYSQGQAYALQTFYYLHLAQHYQFTYLKDPAVPAAPLYTELAVSTTKPKGKATLEELYTQIFEDLNETKKLLRGYARPDDNSKFRPSASAINGLLACVCLLTRQWGGVVDVALGAAKGYALITDAKTRMGFNDLSNIEWIQGHPQPISQSDASYNFYYIDAVTPDAHNNFVVNLYFMDLFEAEDIRLDLFRWIREGYLGYRKFYICADQTGGITMMRSAETYLIAAEALTREGQLGEAVKLLNTLRNARGLADYDLTGKTQEQFISGILLKHRRELWGEGFDITNMLHTQRAVVREVLMKEEAEKKYDRQQQDGPYEGYNPEGHRFTSFPDGTGSVPDSIYYLYSIPGKETNANPNLQVETL